MGICLVVCSRDLMSDLYLNFKKANPNVEVVMTIGNNDPISSKDKYAPKNPDDKRNSIEFFMGTIKTFENNDINVVCSNLRDKTTGKYPDRIKPYKVVERDGDRIFVTGFCIDRLPSKALNVDVIPQDEVFDGLIADIEREKPDAIIVIKQIYLDDAPLFDEKGEAIEPNRKISCAFDNFIPTDGRSEILQNANKEDVIIGGKKIKN